MNLDDLKAIRNEERRSRRLTALQNNFYSELKEYLDSLKKRDDPQKKDELENALRVVDAIYDKRAAKIIKLAALAAKGHKEDVSLAEAETKIYDTVYSVFSNYRDYLLAREGHKEKDSSRLLTLGANNKHTADMPLSEGAPFLVKPDDARVTQHQTGKRSQRLNDFNEDIKKNADLGEAYNDERTLIQEHDNMRYLHVRVLTDIPTFIGLDGKNYKLGEGETAVLPEGNAKALSNRKMAFIVGDKLEDAKEG